MNERSKQIITLVATFLGVLGPAIGSLTFNPGGSDTGQISDRFFADVTIVPADYAFAIWAPIYLGFLAFAVFQVLPAQRTNPRFVRARWWVTASALLNGAWLLVFNNLLFTLSALVIIGMLITALGIHRALSIGHTSVTGLERWLRAPFSLYAAWLTVATVVNVSGALELAGWGGFGVSFATWGALMLIIATLIGLFARFRLNDPVYGGVFVWAFIAIAVASNQPVIVILTASILALVFALSLLPHLFSQAVGSAKGRTA